MSITDEGMKVSPTTVQAAGDGGLRTCPYCFRVIAAKAYDAHVERCAELARRSR